jgi:hypothetical protein
LEKPTITLFDDIDQAFHWRRDAGHCVADASPEGRRDAGLHDGMAARRGNPRLASLAPDLRKS